VIGVSFEVRMKAERERIKKKLQELEEEIAETIACLRDQYPEFAKNVNNH
jgi:hypothetical protein